MTGRAVTDHLVLMARSGLMTHVAELEPPVTAGAMARFRAEASPQVSNMMALSSGSFALCLESGAQALTSSVPHRLRPIGEVLDGAAPAETPAADPAQPSDAAAPPAHASDGAPDGTASRSEGAASGAAPEPHRAASPPQAPAIPAPQPRRILPPSLRRSADLPVAQGIASDLAPAGPAAAEVAPAPPPPDASEMRLDALAEGQDALAARIEAMAATLTTLEQRNVADRDAAHDRLGSALHAVEGRLAAALDSHVAALSDRVADAVGTGLSHLSEQQGRGQAETEAALQGREGRDKARADLQQERLMAAIAASEDAGRTGLASLNDAVQTLALARAEDEAHIAESFATLRIGLRAMNDRLADLGAQLSRPAAPALPDHAARPAPVHPDATPDRSGPGAPVARLHPDAGQGGWDPSAAGPALHDVPAPVALDDTPARLPRHSETGPLQGHGTRIGGDTARADLRAALRAVLDGLEAPHAPHANRAPPPMPGPDRQDRRDGSGG